jgi:ribosome biogenesis GTPase A
MWVDRGIAFTLRGVHSLVAEGTRRSASLDNLVGMSGWRHALSWFPGHVNKASQEMARRLTRVDLVIEVRDARAPRSTCSTHLDHIIAKAGRSHRRVLVINKADLVSPIQRREIERWMEVDHPGVPCFFTSASAASSGGNEHGVREVLRSSIERVREAAPRLFRPAGGPVAAATSSTAQAISDAAATAAGGAMPTDTSLPLIMMVTGVPNVGKSSLINAFRRLAASEAAKAKRKAADGATAGVASGRASTAGTIWPGAARPRSRKPARTGALPGVTRSLSGFQVSWKPSSVWMLDTPGVLAPRVDGGWEAALRLAVLDLIKYEHPALEGIGAYALYHLARTGSRELKRWPSASSLVGDGFGEDQTSSPAATGGGYRGIADIHGTGPDPFATGGAMDAVDDGAACSEERRALRLLTAVAMDMGLTKRGRNGERIPDESGAAGRVLGLLRKGQLGTICFDAYTPELERRRRIERGVTASGAAWNSSGSLGAVPSSARGARRRSQPRSARGRSRPAVV